MPVEAYEVFELHVNVISIMPSSPTAPLMSVRLSTKIVPEYKTLLADTASEATDAPSEDLAEAIPSNLYSLRNIEFRK